MSHAKYAGFEFATKQGLASAAVTTDGNGSSIDRLTYSHAVCVLNIGAFASGTMDISIQDSADGSTGWANFVPNVYFDSNNTAQTVAAFPQKTTTAANTVTKLDVDLSAAKRYIRFVKTANSGGCSATFGVDVLLGQRDGTQPGATA